MTKYRLIAIALHVSPTNGHGFSNLFVGLQYTGVNTETSPHNDKMYKNENKLLTHKNNCTFYREMVSINSKGKWHWLLKGKVAMNGSVTVHMSSF